MNVEEQRARARYADKMRKRGTPLKVLPEEFERAVALLGKARDHGMDDAMIAQQCGLKEMCMYKVRVRAYTTMRRATYDRIMRLRPEPITSHSHPTKTKIPDGAQMSSVGTVRRLHALRADGYPLTAIATPLGVTIEAVSDMCRTPRATVYRTTYLEVKAVYEKLADTTPIDLGFSEVDVKRAKRYARGFPPPSCWDEDTIDDPDAFPEWTGACGTEEGYRIHIRETFFNNNPLPPCGPCRKSMESSTHTDEVVFSVEKFLAIQKESGLNSKELAEKSGVHSDTIYRWRSGVRTPRKRAKVEALADALGCNTEDLLDGEATDSVAVRTVGAAGDGKFNPHILRVLLELSGMSYGAAARLPGATVSSVGLSYWARGVTAPASPEKIKFLADHFGATVEGFYS